MKHIFCLIGLHKWMTLPYAHAVERCERDQCPAIRENEAIYINRIFL